MSAEAQRLSSAFSTISGNLSLPHLECLLIVATKEGISVNGVAESLNMPQQSASRYISHLLGRYAQADTEVVQYLEQEINRDDPRARSLRLTERGQKLISLLTGVQP